MKNFKKLFIVIFMISLTTHVFSQTIRIKGGLNLSNMYAVNDGEVLSSDFKYLMGYNAGLTLELPVSDIFSFETGLIINTKGFEYQDSFEYDELYKIKTTYDLLYLDIPLTAKASTEIGNVTVYGTFGPYIGIGLKGQLSVEESYDNYSESYVERVSFGSDE